MILLSISMLGLGFMGGEYATRLLKDPVECMPGYVMAKIHPDGARTCWYERKDWRYGLEKRPPKPRNKPL